MACPRCMVAPGEVCVYPKPNPKGMNHELRHEAAVAQGLPDVCADKTFAKRLGAAVFSHHVPSRPRKPALDDIHNAT